MKLLDYDDNGIVFKEIDKLNNVKIYYKKEFIDVNVRRLQLDLPASELYPMGYDMSQLFSDFKDRKFERDMVRGSKKALKKIQKESKKSKR